MLYMLAWAGLPSLQVVEYGFLASLDRSGSAPWPIQHSLAVEVFNCGGWLTHGDLVLEALVDFIAVVEHRSIPARVRSEWARLRAEGCASVWAPASQEASHVGHAGVGVVV